MHPAFIHFHTMMKIRKMTVALEASIEWDWCDVLSLSSQH